MPFTASLNPALPILLLFLLLLPPFHAEQLAYDFCNATVPCADHLVCGMETSQQCPPGVSSCVCLPREDSTCADSTTCRDGERCVRFLTPPNSTSCMSCKTVNDFKNTEVFDQVVDRNPDTCTSFLGGYIRDPCGRPGDTPCVSPNACSKTLEGGDFRICSPGDEECTCGTFYRCKSSSDCPSGNRCVLQKNTSFCVGCRAAVLKNYIVVDQDESKCATESPAPPTGPYQGGYFGDLCTTKSTSSSESVVTKCQLELECVARVEPNEVCMPTSEICRCRVGRRIRACNVSDHCPRGERCIITINGSETFRQCGGCQSSDALVKEGHASFVDNGNTCIQFGYTATPSPSPISPSPTPSNSPKLPLPRGLTFDTCVGDERSICRGSRICNAGLTTRPCGRDDTDCRCSPTQTISCSMSDVCPGGERCIREDSEKNICVACTAVIKFEMETVDGNENCWKVNSEEPTSPLPVSSPSSSTVAPPAVVSPVASVASSSASASPSSGSSGDGVCVAVEHLAGLSSGDLTFAKHREAWVWCDVSGSCATGGHVVVWRGTAMRMRRYCDSVGGCIRRRMLVNSPRWRRRLRVESRTVGLKFTALAARWETALEEKMLATLVRLGA